jgi:branched-chain amino acid transport system substrate-binding protein
MEAGIKTYFQVNGDTVAGRKIEIILRDTTGPSPDIAKRHAQDLILRDKVDFLAGFSLTPEALAVAPVATEAKKPMIIMNAATSIITTKSPYVARLSMTLAQVASPMGTWAFKSGIKRVVTVVTDYGPGIDAETAFKASFTGAGGQIIESLRVPLQNPDFAPFIQRVKDAKPEAVFVFVPAGGQGIAFMKTFHERGLADAGIKVIATGDLTDDHLLDSMGDPALNVVTSFHYSASHDTPENKAFLKAYADANGAQGGRPNFVAVAAPRRHDRRRQGNGDSQRHAHQQPARTDRDRPRDARRRSDRVYPARRTSQRPALQHRVRKVRRREGSWQVGPGCHSHAGDVASGGRMNTACEMPPAFRALADVAARARSSECR